MLLTQTGVFLSILSLGVVFFIVSAIFGGDDGDQHDGAESAPSFLSIRNIFLLATGFGAGGLIGTHLGLGALGASVVGFASGLTFAALGFAFYKSVRKQQVSTGFDSRKLVGKLAYVTESIPAGLSGMIHTTDEWGHVTYMAARCQDPTRKISVGTTVEITESNGHVATVK